MRKRWGLSLAFLLSLCALVVVGCHSTGSKSHFTELAGFEGMPTVTAPEPTLRPQVAETPPATQPPSSGGAAETGTTRSPEITGEVTSGTTRPKPGPPTPIEPLAGSSVQSPEPVVTQATPSPLGTQPTNRPVFTDPSAQSAPQPISPTGSTPPSARATSKKSRPGPNVLDDGRIKPGEPIVITFSDMPQAIPPFEDKVKEDGTITLMYFQAFHAAGMSTHQLEQEIRSRYVPSWFQNLTVTVRRVEVVRSYFVEGEVKQPGQRAYTGPITVSQAITACGGFTDFASKGRIRIIRTNGEKEKVSWSRILSHPEQDPQVFPNDKIHVPRSWF